MEHHSAYLRPLVCSLLLNPASDAASRLMAVPGTRAMVEGICEAKNDTEAAAFCPTSAASLLPPMPADLLRTREGMALASLQADICEGRTQPGPLGKLARLPWPCDVPSGIVSATQCVDGTAAPGNCMLTAGDLYGEDVAAYRSAAQAFAAANPAFHGFACSTEISETDKHSQELRNLMCGAALQPESGASAAQANMDAVRAFYCGEGPTSEAGPGFRAL